MNIKIYNFFKNVGLFKDINVNFLVIGLEKICEYLSIFLESIIKEI